MTSKRYSKLLRKTFVKFVYLFIIFYVCPHVNIFNENDCLYTVYTLRIDRNLGYSGIARFSRDSTTFLLQTQFKISMYYSHAVTFVRA